MKRLAAAGITTTSHIRKRGGSDGDKEVSVRVRSAVAFTIVELLVVISIIAVLASLLLPALSRAKENGQSARCKSNLRQIGLGLSMYTTDHGFYPPYQEDDWILKLRRTWFHRILPYTGGTWSNGVFVCPLFTAGALDWDLAFSGSAAGGMIGGSLPRGSYGYNGSGTGSGGSLTLEPPRLLGLGARSGSKRVSESMVLRPADMIAIGDASGEDQLFVFQDVASQLSRHRHSHNTHFCDGHVEQMKIGERGKKAEGVRRRWNIDHEPHPETWAD